MVGGEEFGVVGEVGDVPVGAEVGEVEGAVGGVFEGLVSARGVVGEAEEVGAAAVVDGVDDGGGRVDAEVVEAEGVANGAREGGASDLEEEDSSFIEAAGDPGGDGGSRGGAEGVEPGEDRGVGGVGTDAVGEVVHAREGIAAPRRCQAAMVMMVRVRRW